jgi:hypothetical protein
VRIEMILHPVRQCGNACNAAVEINARDRTEAFSRRSRAAIEYARSATAERWESPLTIGSRRADCRFDGRTAR